MNRFGEADDPRRRLLIQALAAGMFYVGPPGARVLAADLFGRKPAKLPAGQSIYRLSGTAQVNGAPATLQTRIGASDTVETGKNSEIVFAVGENAFILRGDSRMVLETADKDKEKEKSSLLVSALRLLTGALLSVHARPARVSTPTATIGIRGTGMYLETDPEKTYFCNCYGSTQVTAANDPESKMGIKSKHHDQPIYILAKAEPGESIQKAPFINHTDQELTLIEALLGRAPPFVFPRDDYKSPRRGYEY
jgi:hypothetical protein